MESDVLLSAYIDLNLMVAIGVGLWLALRGGLAVFRLDRSYGAQLRLLNFLTILMPAAPIVVLATVQYGLHSPSNISDLLIAQYLDGNVNISATQLQNLMGLREEAVRDILSQQSGIARLIAGLFASGVLLSAVLVLNAVWQLRRSLRSAVVLKQIGCVVLLASDHAPVAFSTRGLFRRYVVLPTPLVSRPDDLRITIAHELQHLRQGDVEYELLLELMRPLLFWNPAFYLWRQQVHSLREFACDQSLLTRRKFSPRDYCECLIRACADTLKHPVFYRLHGPVTPLLNPREIRRPRALASRIRAATAPLPTSPLAVPASAVMAMVMAIAVFYAAALIQRHNDWSHDRIMLSTIVNLERMEHRRAASARLATAALNGAFVTEAQ